MDNKWKFAHIGVVVMDMDKTVAFFEAIGADTSQPERVHPVSKNRIRLIRLGSLALELFQVGEGTSPARDFLNKRGQGMFHLGFSTEDFDSVKAKMLEQGSSIILTAPGGNTVYIDPPEAGGNVIMEISKAQ